MSSALAKRHLARIHELQCVVCQHCMARYRPCEEAHHVEFDRHEDSDFATVPLCADCHTLLHKMHRKAFYSLHNLTDTKLLAWAARSMAALIESR